MSGFQCHPAPASVDPAPGSAGNGPAVGNTASGLPRQPVEPGMVVPPVLSLADCSTLIDTGGVTEAVEAIYAAASAVLAGAGPLPLAGSEAWAMPDADYAGVLATWAPWLNREDWREINEGATLDEIGSDVGLPRPRLVPVDRIADLDIVEVIAAVVSDEGPIVPAGTQGIVVAVYGGGEAYEVEFGTDDPADSLLCTVPADGVRLVGKG